MYGIIYKITNVKNNKIYIGQTKGTIQARFKQHIRAALKEIDKKRKLRCRLAEAIRKYGKDSFEIQVIDQAETKDELNTKEIYWIEKLQARNPKIGYNLAKGGNLALSYDKHGKNNPNYGKHVSEETRKKLKEAAKGHWSGEKNPMYNVHRQGADHPMFGKHHSEEAKQKISKANKGRKQTTPISEETRQKLRIASLGRHQTEESKLKISKANKGRKMSQEIKDWHRHQMLGKIFVNNGVILKCISLEDKEKYLNEGWEEGQGNLKPKKKGTCWINNGEIQKYIPAEDLSYYLEQGFQKGMLPRKK